MLSLPRRLLLRLHVALLSLFLCRNCLVSTSRLLRAAKAGLLSILLICLCGLVLLVSSSGLLRCAAPCFLGLYAGHLRPPFPDLAIGYHLPVTPSHSRSERGKPTTCTVKPALLHPLLPSWISRPTISRHVAVIVAVAVVAAVVTASDLLTCTPHSQQAPIVRQSIPLLSTLVSLISSLPKFLPCQSLALYHFRGVCLLPSPCVSSAWLPHFIARDSPNLSLTPLRG